MEHMRDGHRDGPYYRKMGDVSEQDKQRSPEAGCEFRMTDGGAEVSGAPKPKLRTRHT